MAHFGRLVLNHFTNKLFRAAHIFLCQATSLSTQSKWLQPEGRASGDQNLLRLWLLHLSIYLQNWARDSQEWPQWITEYATEAIGVNSGKDISVTVGENTGVWITYLCSLLVPFDLVITWSEVPLPLCNGLVLGCTPKTCKPCSCPALRLGWRKKELETAMVYWTREPSTKGPGATLLPLMADGGQGMAAIFAAWRKKLPFIWWIDIRWAHQFPGTNKAL